MVSLVVPGSESYQNWQLVVYKTVDDKGVEQIKAIPYGKFLADVLNFLIVAFVVFLFLKKFMGWIMPIQTIDFHLGPAQQKIGPRG